MQRISTLNRVLSLFGVGKDGFKNGDLASGVLPTEFNAAWCNSIQEELANVVEAGGIALNGGSYVQLLAALRAAGVFSTPVQLDNTTKAATTAFVQRALGNRSGYVIFNANQILANAAFGGVYESSGSASLTCQLPSAAVYPGGVVSLCNNQSSGTLTASSAGGIFYGPGYPAGIATVVLPSRVSADFVSDGTNWKVFLGAGITSSSLGGGGWKKYPDINSPTGCTIEQWGVLTDSAWTANVERLISFPITFPLAGVSTLCSSSNTNYATTANARVASPSQIAVCVAAGGAQSVNWRAYGY